MIRQRFALGGAALVLLTGCGSSATSVDTTTSVGGSSSTSVFMTTVADIATSTTISTSTTIATATTLPDGLSVEVRAGEVVGGIPRFELSLGDEVTILVTSDVADEIHLHGYDITTEVAVGETVEIIFDADIPGIFEAELEDRGQEIFEIEVS